METHEIIVAVIVGFLSLFVMMKRVNSKRKRMNSKRTLGSSRAKHSAPQSASKSFLGCIVRLKDVPSEPKLNGQSAIVIGHQPDKQIYMVHLLDVSSRPMQIATDKLHLADPLRAAVSGSKIGDITVCNELAPALGNARVLSMDLNQSNFHNLDKLPKKPKGKQHWYQVMLWACQHELSIHVVKTGDGSIYARVFQCYYGANTYSAKEWLQKQRWMNFDEYVHFLSQLREIRRKTKKFVRDNLLPSLALPPNMSPVHYANMIINDTHIGGGPSPLRAQPASVRAIGQFIRERQQPGVDPDTILGALFVDTECCLSFHIGPWRDLMNLHQKVFHGTSAAFPLVALQYHKPVTNGLELGYCWREHHVL